MYMNILGIIVTVAVIVFIYLFLKYFFTDPYTISGQQDGKTTTIISSQSLASNGTNVPSTNFAYSVWIYVNDWNYRYGEPKIIFGRLGADGNIGSDPCPVAVLGAVENNLIVSTSCYSTDEQNPTNTIIHNCDVTNIELQKWVNVVVSVYNRTMDIYLDGKLVKTCLLPGVAYINPNANVYLTPHGGFSGWTGRFQYYPNSLNPQEVWNIYSKGYNTWASAFSTYSIKVSLEQNGNPQSSINL